MVAIKEIKMPKNCEECQFSMPYLNREGERHVLCDIEVEAETVGKAITRNSHCPLIEIPDDAIIISEEMCCFVRDNGAPLIAHYYNDEELKELWKRQFQEAEKGAHDGTASE